MGIEYVNHRFVIESENEFFLVDSSLKNNKKITKVQMGKFTNSNSNSKAIEIDVKDNR